MTTGMENLKSAMEDQQSLLETLLSKLQQLEVGGGGGGPVGPIYASNVICQNDPTVTSTTNAQASLDEIYSMLQVLDDALDAVL